MVLVICAIHECLRLKYSVWYIFIFSIQYLYICLKTDQFLIQYLSAYLSEEWWVYFITRSFNRSICSLFMYNIIVVWFSSVTQEKEFCYDISWPFFFPPNGIVQRLDRKVSVYTAQQKYISEPFRICLWEKDCKHTLNSRISRPAKWRTKHCNYPN